MRKSVFTKLPYQYRWISIDTVKAVESLIQRGGDYKTERDKYRFLKYFDSLGGVHRRLSKEIKAERKAVLSSVILLFLERETPLWIWTKADRSDIYPTTAHCFLALWAYSPTPMLLNKYLRENGFLL